MSAKTQRILVINLPYRTDRRREVESCLRRATFPQVEIFPAIRPASHLPFGSIGEHGAFLSHQAVLRRARGACRVIVLEDDVAFTASYTSLVSQLDQLPPDWELYYGGYIEVPDTIGSPPQDHPLPLDPSVQLTGAHCYAVNGPAIDKLLGALDVFLSRPRGHPEGGPMPFDGALNVARRQMALKTFVAVPPIAHQRSSRTDIATLKWFDRLPLLRQTVGVLRRAKNAWISANAATSRGP